MINRKGILISIVTASLARGSTVMSVCHHRVNTTGKGSDVTA